MRQLSAPSYELSCLDGLQPFLTPEIHRRLRKHEYIGRQERRGVRILYPGRLDDLLALRTPTNAWRLLTFRGQRPTAVTGDQQLPRALTLITSSHRFRGFRLEGPGI